MDGDWALFGVTVLAYLFAMVLAAVYSRRRG